MMDLSPPSLASGKSLLDRVEDALLPLINLVFLLLMFFIAAGQLASIPLPDLPGTPANDAPVRPEAHLLVTSDARWRVDGQPVDEQSLLASLPEMEENEPLRIAAAETITMADLTNLFALLETGGYHSVLLLTEPLL
ncbi:ExbD/TolR family protein [Marinobacter sp. F4216]|uniref:ExbD/TolR family protein n=1 Tax=Marinobacter sp. F4216 TaxID=2874281 RepID=UPI001CBDC1F1|nr:biopolymer transporter ExbD [Marinobacter sp. F4216]MBZ2169451.1 biopolymer transporter ExbD [Marinobacter sp. F4216]